MSDIEIIKNDLKKMNELVDELCEHCCDKIPGSIEYAMWKLGTFCFDPERQTPETIAEVNENLRIAIAKIEKIAGIDFVLLHDIYSKVLMVDTFTASIWRHAESEECANRYKERTIKEAKGVLRSYRLAKETYAKKQK